MNRPTAASLRTGGSAVRLTILLTTRDHAHHRSLMVEILKEARRSGIAGATVYEGDAGFGGSGRIHRDHLVSDDRPLALVLVDRRAPIEQLLADIDELLSSTRSVVTVADVEVVPTVTGPPVVAG